MSVCIIRADCPIDNIFFLQFQFSATQSDDPMTGGHLASAVASSATSEASFFARSQAARVEVSHD